MKSQQSGFAHAVLIIGLVVALIGALGFIFWQNFVHEEQAKTDTMTATNSNDSSGHSEDLVEVTREKIKNQMQKGVYDFSDLMASRVNYAVANSDAVGRNVTKDKASKYINNYLSGSFSPTEDWAFNDYSDFVESAFREHSLFDFEGSYIATLGAPDFFRYVAYKINDRGEITDVYIWTHDPS